jgi:hypothetical protein
MTAVVTAVLMPVGTRVLNRGSTGSTRLPVPGDTVNEVRGRWFPTSANACASCNVTAIVTAVVMPAVVTAVPMTVDVTAVVMTVVVTAVLMPAVVTAVVMTAVVTAVVMPVGTRVLNRGSTGSTRLPVPERGAWQVVSRRLPMHVRAVTCLQL